MSKIDRSKLFLALDEDNEMYRAGYHNGMAHGIMINPEFYNDPLAWTTDAGTYVKACGGEFTTSNSKGQDTPVERKYDDSALCKNCAKLAETLGEAARQAKWDNSYEKIEATAELSAATAELREAVESDGVQETAEGIILPTMLTLETREESPAQADGPSVEVVKVETLPKDGARLPGAGTQESREEKRTPFKPAKPKVHKALSEPKMGPEHVTDHTTDRGLRSHDDQQPATSRSAVRTSLTSGRDMTGVMPKERPEGGKPVRTTMDMPLGRERLDVSASVNHRIVQTDSGAKVVRDVVGGKFGFLNGDDYRKLSRTAQRRYWVKVNKARNAHKAQVEAAKAANKSK